MARIGADNRLCGLCKGMCEHSAVWCTGTRTFPSAAVSIKGEIVPLDVSTPSNMVCQANEAARLTDQRRVRVAPQAAAMLQQLRPAVVGRLP